MCEKEKNSKKIVRSSAARMRKFEFNERKPDIVMKNNSAERISVKKINQGKSKVCRDFNSFLNRIMKLSIV